MTNVQKKKAYKLTIKGLPLSVQNKEVKSFLLSKGIKPASRIMFSYIRHKDGTFTKYKDGDRFVYCYESNTSTRLTQTILGHHCVLYHHPRNRNTLKNSIYTRQKSNSIQQEKMVSIALMKQWLPHIRFIQTPALLAKVNRREIQEKAPQPHRCLSTIQIGLHISSPSKICRYLCHIKKCGSCY